MKKILVFSILITLMVIGLSMPCFAARITTKTIDVSASIPTLNGGLNVSVWKVVPANCTPSAAQTWSAATSMNFGTLWFDNDSSWSFLLLMVERCFRQNGCIQPTPQLETRKPIFNAIEFSGDIQLLPCINNNKNK